MIRCLIMLVGSQIITVNLIAQSPIIHVDTIIINSGILNETRQITVFIPEMTMGDSLLLLCMFDGENADYLYHQLSVSDSLNPLLGVGIINTNRRRDLLPAYGANSFNCFIEQELIPMIGSRYPISERILFGHSFGGAAVIYSLLHFPGLFDAYIASSAKPIMDMIDSEYYEREDSLLTSPVFFHVSYGSKDHRSVRKWNNKLKSNLSESVLNKIEWSIEELPGVGHDNSDIVALQKGLAELREFKLLPYCDN